MQVPEQARESIESKLIIINKQLHELAMRASSLDRKLNGARPEPANKTMPPTADSVHNLLDEIAQHVADLNEFFRDAHNSIGAFHESTPSQLGAAVRGY